MTGKAISRRDGTTAQHAIFTGLPSEITIDTDKQTIVVHDGVTPGGTPLAKEEDLYTDADVTAFNLTNGVRNSVGYATADEIRALPTPTALNLKVELYGPQGGVFVADLSDTTTPEDGVSGSAGTVIVSAAGVRYKRQIINGAITPEMFGSDTLNESDCIQACFDAALIIGSVVKLSGKTYSFDKSVTVPSGVCVLGAGMGVSVFDFSGVSSADISENTNLKIGSGELLELPALSNNATKDGKTLSFSSEHDLEVNDFIIIYNPLDGSFSDFRANYRAGEACKVALVNGLSVTLDGSLYDSYDATDIKVYKVVNPAIGFLKDISIIGSPVAGTLGLSLNYGKDFTLENVESFGAVYSGIVLNNSLNVNVNGCVSSDNHANDSNEDYGLIISNCQAVKVTSCRLISNRHGLSIGGGDNDGDFVNRGIIVSGSHIGTTGEIQAADIHGNSEHILFVDNVIDGGITPGGGSFTLDSNTIRGEIVNGPVCCYVTDLIDTNINIVNNTFETSKRSSGRGCFIDIGGNSLVIDSRTRRGGLIKISGNTFVMKGEEPQIDGIVIYQRGFLSEPIDIEFSNNTSRIESSNPLNRMDSLLRVRAIAGMFDNVWFTDNKGDGGLMTTPNNSANIANNFFVKGNILARGGQCIIDHVKNIAVFSGNQINDFKYGAGIRGKSNTDRTLTSILESNTVVDGLWMNASSSSSNTSLFNWFSEKSKSFANYTENKFKRIGVVNFSGTFEAGETVTGATSGATATVYSSTANYLLVRDSIFGTFSANETVTGSTSGATADLSSGVIDSRSHSLYTLWVGSLWRGSNVDADGVPETQAAATVDTVI